MAVNHMLVRSAVGRYCAKERTKGVLDDIILVSRGGVRMAANRALLAAKSSLLREMLQDNMRTIFLDIASSELEKILDFIYCGEIKFKKVSLLGLVFIFLIY